MSKTILSVNTTGVATLTPAKVAILKDWYSFVIDKNNHDSDWNDYFRGATHMLESTLDLLYNNVPADRHPELVTVIKPRKGFRIKKWHIVAEAVVILVLVDGRLPKKIKAILDEKFPIEPIKKY